jgi:hypothetical protein
VYPISKNVTMKRQVGIVNQARRSPVGAMIRRPQAAEILPEPDLPDGRALVSRGKRLAGTATVGASSFLAEHRVASEAAYKRRRMAEGALMLHAQIGYRDLAKSCRAYVEIHDAIDRLGGRVDRYGICLDWSMGYPRSMRQDMPQGTGLILDDPADFAALTRQAPVAPHFGDFVIGMPAALENTVAALAAGRPRSATSVSTSPSVSPAGATTSAPPRRPSRPWRCSPHSRSRSSFTPTWMMASQPCSTISPAASGRSCSNVTSSKT